jgi:excisionase family DNA binding protein
MGYMKNFETFQPPLTKEQAALWLGISLRGLERAMSARRIKYFKVGKRVNFDLSDVEHFRNSNAVLARQSGGAK